MKTHELVQRCESALDPETFAELMQVLQTLTMAKNTAVARHNHYLIGFESMIAHKCQDAAFRYVPGKPHGHFVCIECEAKI